MDCPSCPLECIKREGRASDIPTVTNVSLLACLFIVWERLARESGSRFSETFKRMLPSVFLTRAALVALPVLYGAQLSLLSSQALATRGFDRFFWMRDLPLPVFDGRADNGYGNAFYSSSCLAIGGFEAFALGVVVLALRNGTLVRNHVFVAVAAVLAIFSLASPAMSTTDPYEYVATGLLKFGSYSAATHALDGTIYAPVAAHVPLTGVIYGPLWVFVDTLQTSFGATIYQKIEALRITNIGFVIAFLVVLAKCNFRREIIVALAINPALWLYVVANPHADIQGLLYLVLALFFARRSNWALAVLFIVCGGLTKLPFAVLGGLMLAPIPEPRRRIALWIAAVSIVLMVSYFVPGHAYVFDLSKFAAAKAKTNWSPAWIFMTPAIVVLTFVTVLLRKGYIGVSWLFDQIGPLAGPWYMLWGIPYALVMGPADVYFVAMPFAATLRDATFELDIASIFLIVLTIVAFSYDQVLPRWRAVRRTAIESGDLANRLSIAKLVELSGASPQNVP